MNFSPAFSFFHFILLNTYVTKEMYNLRCFRHLTGDASLGSKRHNKCILHPVDTAPLGVTSSLCRRGEPVCSPDVCSPVLIGQTRRSAPTPIGGIAEQNNSWFYRAIHPQTECNKDKKEWIFSLNRCFFCIIRLCCDKKTISVFTMNRVVIVIIYRLRAYWLRRLLSRKK